MVLHKSSRPVLHRRILYTIAVQVKVVAEMVPAAVLCSSKKSHDIHAECLPLTSAVYEIYLGNAERMGGWRNLEFLIFKG